MYVYMFILRAVVCVCVKMYVYEKIIVYLGYIACCCDACVLLCVLMCCVVYVHVCLFCIVLRIRCATLLHVCIWSVLYKNNL